MLLAVDVYLTLLLLASLLAISRCSHWTTHGDPHLLPPFLAPTFCAFLLLLLLPPAREPTCCAPIDLLASIRALPMRLSVTAAIARCADTRVTLFFCWGAPSWISCPSLSLPFAFAFFDHSPPPPNNHRDRYSSTRKSHNRFPRQPDVIESSDHPADRFSLSRAALHRLAISPNWRAVTDRRIPV